MPLAHPQTTVDHAVFGAGITLHTGCHVCVSICPAQAGEGLVFVRKDLPGAPRVKVSPEAVNREALRRRTELVGEDGAVVATPEHILATALAMGLDNALIELDGPELPIFDGSARHWARLIREAGFRQLDAPRRPWRLRRPVTLVQDQASIFAHPAEQMALAFIAELRHAGMANQTVCMTLSAEEFENKLAPARTFCFFEEIERLRQAGLIRGGSMDCAIVIRDGQPLDTDYRLPNELACHKMVDLIGDLAVLGRPVAAYISAHGTGHNLNHAFIELLRKELAEDA